MKRMTAFHQDKIRNIDNSIRVGDRSIRASALATQGIRLSSLRAQPAPHIEDKASNPLWLLLPPQKLLISRNKYFLLISGFLISPPVRTATSRAMPI